MILANVRQQLTRDDAQLLLRLVGRGSSLELDRAEVTLRDHGIDSLLDEPRVLRALLEARQGCHASMPLFSYVVVRHALREIGEHDRMIADYVASVLMSFGARDRAHRVGAADDERYDTLAELARDVEGGDVQRSFLVRAHMGNYALWLSGLYPDYIEHRCLRRGGPDLEYYEDMGRRGFQLAGDHRMANDHGMAPLFHAVAAAFSKLRVALNHVSDRLLFPQNNSPERLMRQVRDDFLWKPA